MDLFDNLHIGSLTGLSALAVIVCIVVTGVLILVVFIINAIRAIKENKDAKEDTREKEFYKEYGLSPEEMRLNLKLARLRGQKRAIVRDELDHNETSTVQSLISEQAPAPEQAPQEEPLPEEPKEEPIPEEPKAEEPVQEPEPEPQPEPTPEPEPEPEPTPEPEPQPEPEPEPQPEPAPEPAPEPEPEPQPEEPAPKVEEAPAPTEEPKEEKESTPIPEQKQEEPKEEAPLPEDDAEKATDAGKKKQGIVKPATKKVVKKKPDDWSKYEGDYEGYYYDPEDACYYEGEAPAALKKKLDEKRKELEAQNAKGEKKVVIKKIAPPFATLKTPKHERKAPAPVAGFDESVIYGKYVIEHTGDEYYYTLYDSSNKALYTSGNYSTLDYCKRAITRFKTHVLVGDYTTESVDGKFCCVIRRKTYTHRADPVATFDEAEALKKQIKSFAQTDIIREQ
jgi:hypothetical protein